MKILGNYRFLGEFKEGEVHKPKAWFQGGWENKVIIYILEFKKLFNYDFIISIGDYINDLELFRYSDIKIAPIKSHKIIQKMADYLIKDFNDLLEILRKFSFS